MGGMQVTMAVSYFTFTYSFIEQAGIAQYEIIGVTFNLLIFCRWNGNADVFLGLKEVLLTVLADSI